MKNPKEKKTLKDYRFRGILDIGNKNVYIFNHELLHEDAVTNLVNEISDDYILLAGRCFQGKLDCERNFSKKDLGENYDWMSGCLTGFSVE